MRTIANVQDLIRQQRLQEPFGPSDLEWRVQSAGKSNGGLWALVVPYITARAIQDRLDEVFGVTGWQFNLREHSGGGLIGALGIRSDDGEWIWKEDVGGSLEASGGLSAGDAAKGEASNALKRCGVDLGIGRYLYRLEATFVNPSDNGVLKGQAKINGERVRFKFDPPNLPAWALPGAGTDEVDTERLAIKLEQVDTTPGLLHGLDEDQVKALKAASALVAGSARRITQNRIDSAVEFVDGLLNSAEGSD